MIVLSQQRKAQWAEINTPKLSSKKYYYPLHQGTENYTKQEETGKWKLHHRKNLQSLQTSVELQIHVTEALQTSPALKVSEGGEHKTPQERRSTNGEQIL